MNFSTIDFFEAVSTNEIKDILFGNGFSLALDKKRGSDLFSFHSLFEKANFSEELLRLMGPDEGGREGLGHAPNFEKALKAVRDSELIHTFLEFNETEKFEELSRIIRTGLITAIESVHTSADGEELTPTRDEAVALNELLKHFSDRDSLIFTINYDLLLYKALMQIKEFSAQLENAGDAFVTEIEDKFKWEDWSSWGRPRFCFLHGGIHIFKEGRDAYKIARDEDTSLTQKIKSRIQENIIPLFVSEGTPNRKLSRIYGVPYLQDSFERLRNAKGLFFIYGSSICDEDNHIWSALKNNSALDKIYIGYHGAENKSEIARRIRQNFNDDARIELFDTSLIHLWGEADE